MQLSALRAGLLALLVVALGPTPLRAQQVNVITTSFGPAAASDLISRLLATEFSQQFNENWVVKNIVGAAGTIAANEVVRAKPDGSNLLLSPIGPITVQPYFMRNAGYRTEDLLPICMTTRSPLVLMAHKSSGLTTMAEVISRARGSSDPMNFGSTGPGTLPHLSMVTFSRMAGVPLVHIAYKGPSEVQLALEQGGVQLYADLPNLVLNDPAFRAIAVMAPARLERYPDLPTFREAGYEIDFSIWLGLFAPRGTPPAIVARYEGACERATRQAAVILGHERLQMPITYRNAKTFAAIVQADAERNRSIVEEGNLRQAE
ncbi:tripartite tricarboxylate transporter substrate binding protein [Roseicella sp. DB1501]|uniref:Bug family tripartite tricarboxylate transporter substrate binding protein n=1 Tax=Roseicella sp. DB1501 TaxID=2730925 RepID=UPI00149148FA|nr:tripartite tricarboxylate transporter substrate binding protein [Roseicella sp. DB1501]NOG71266.1 tripartite tricarboxylate transporter substrate binding protein [Roseicella sp. DB1501]